MKNILTPLMLLIFAALFYLAWVALTPAQAHEWFAGTTNVKGGSCCGGADCANIRFDAVREVAGGFIVTLTKDEMQRVRPSLGKPQYGPFGSYENNSFKNLEHGIVEFVPAREAQSAADGNYSVCLHGSPVKPNADLPERWINCFFIPSNS